MSLKVLFVASALAASSLVNAVVIPIRRQETSSGLTCVGKAPGEQFVTKLASNVQFEVRCGRDYYGSDLENGLRWPGSFEGCLAACEAESECQAVSWVDGPCYLKGGVSTLSEGNDAVWTAKKNPPPTCVGSVNSDGATYITSAGNFEIICGKDYGGNDMQGVTTESFAACVEHCAADDKCVDVSYVYGACYPKSALSTLTDASWVWTAKFLGTRASASPSPTAPTGSTPTPEAAKALSCIDKVNNGAQYKEFSVECGVDHWGADIGAVPYTTTFEECMDACEANSECTVVSWVWGSCYMKNLANPGQDVEHVWGAVRAPRVTAASSSDAVVTPSDAAVAPSDASVTPSGVIDVITPTPSADAVVTPSDLADLAAATPSDEVTPSEVVDITPSTPSANASITPSIDADIAPSESSEALIPTPTADAAATPSAEAVFAPSDASGAVISTPSPDNVITASSDSSAVIPTPTTDSSPSVDVSPLESSASTITPTPSIVGASADASPASITPAPSSSSIQQDLTTSTITE